MYNLWKADISLLPTFRFRRIRHKTLRQISPVLEQVDKEYRQDKFILSSLWMVGVAQSVQQLATGWTVRGSNSVEGQIFRFRLDWPWGPPSLLCNGHQISFPGVKRPGRGVSHPHPSSAEVKERVELYLYSPSGPSWPVLGRNSCLILTVERTHKYLRSSHSK